MIGFTKLLCGKATVSDVIKERDKESGVKDPKLLQFTTENRPLVVWNVTKACNLKCKHCYINAGEKASNELTTEEAKVLIDDLANLGTPVLLFSGGEPLLREDIFELAEYAFSKGIRPVLSSNGTLITKDVAKRLKDSHFQYVGISLDGLEKVHDDFRGVEGAFRKSIEGIKNCLEIDLKSGVRFTVNQMNFKDLSDVLDFVAENNIPRFCMYHLVYSGRGKEMLELDLTKDQNVELFDILVKKTKEFDKKGVDLEILTTDNHADGIALYLYLTSNEPDRADEIKELLKMHGGCSAGTKFANIDNEGNVHPCQFWLHYNLGNIRERPFSQIWTDENEPLLKKLRNKEKYLKGICGECKYNYLCGGCRIRAEVVHGDIMQEDPACYIDKLEF